MAIKKFRKEPITQEPLSQELTEKKPRKKRRFLRRILILATVLFVVITVAVLSAMQDSNQFAALRRYLKYGDSAQTQNLYTYASHQSNLFEPLGEELLVVNPHSIQILHRDGPAIYDLQVSMTAPLISVGTELAAVSDVQSSEVYVLSSTGLRWTHRNADGLFAYSARMSGNDYLAITEQKTGYKSSVSVYDNKGTLIFRFDSHDHYLTDAMVTRDGKQLIVLAPGENAGSFSTTVIVYDLATAGRIGSYALTDGLALDLSTTEDSAIMLCDNRLAILSASGQIRLNYEYGEEYLHDYTLTGSNFCALLLSRYRSSNLCTLTTFSSDGTQLASLELTDEVLDINAAGERLAVLFSDTLILYDRELNEVARLEGTEHAGSVRMNEDGTALLIAETSAKRFLP